MALITFHAVDSPGRAWSDVAEISVDDTGIIGHSITNGRSGVSFQNTGTGICWYGGTDANGVSPTNGRGHPLLPMSAVLFTNVQSNFSVGFRCATGLTTTVGVVEYE